MAVSPLIVLLAGYLVVGCTGFKQTDATPGDIGQMIVAGKLIESGDRIRLATADSTVHEFRVTAIDRDRGLVIGNEQAIPIADIVAIETREVSMGKTALLTGGVVGGLAIAMLLVLALVPAIVVL